MAAGNKSDNLNAICEPVVQKMWEHRRLTNLRVPMDRYKDLIHSFISYSTALCWALASFFSYVTFFLYRW
jgi:hypothetical protein